MSFLSKQCHGSDTGSVVVETVFEHGGTDNTRLAHHHPGYPSVKSSPMAVRVAGKVALRQITVGNALLVASPSLGVEVVAIRSLTIFTEVRRQHRRC